MIPSNRCFSSACTCWTASSCGGRVTSTLLMAGAICRTTGGSGGFSPETTETLVFSSVKPPAVMMTVYVPGSTAEKWNEPVWSVRVVRRAVDPGACNLTMADSTIDPDESATVPRTVPGAGLSCAAHDCATRRMQIDDLTAAPHQPGDWPRCCCARIN